MFQRFQKELKGGIARDLGDGGSGADSNLRIFSFEEESLQVVKGGVTETSGQNRNEVMAKAVFGGLVQEESPKVVVDLLIGPVYESAESAMAMEEEGLFVAGDLKDDFPGMFADPLKLLSVWDFVMMGDPQFHGATLLVEIGAPVDMACGQIVVVMAAVGILGESTRGNQECKENQKEKSLHKVCSKTHFVRGLTEMTKD